TIASIAFSGDGEVLSGGMENGVTRVWRVADGREIARVEIPGSAPGVDLPKIIRTALCAHGELLLTDTGALNHLWQLAPDLLIAQACSLLPNGLSEKEWREYVGGEAYRATCPAAAH